MKFPILTSLTLAGLMAASGAAVASSHREAPLISFDPAADNTDLYAWVTPGSHDKLNIVANWIPLEEPAGGPNFHKFADDVLYEVHLARGGESLADKVAYYFRFETTPIGKVSAADKGAAPGGGKEFFAQLSGQEQTYTVFKVTDGKNVTVLASGLSVAPTNFGPRSQGFLFGDAPYDDAFAATYIHDLPNGEGRVFAGPRDDGFYVDLGGAFDLANLRSAGQAQDGVSGFNTHAIVLEIPTTKLTANGQAPGDVGSADTTLGIWAASSRRKVELRQFAGGSISFGPWVQVSRLGLPLVNEVLIGLQDKDRYNASHPSRDVKNFGAYFLNPVIVRDAEAVGIYAALGVDPTPFKYDRTDIINIISLIDDNHAISAIGDVLRVDMAMDSSFPNGRPLIGGASPDQEQADVTDVLLTVILSGGALAIGDGVDYNDKPFLAQMPWLPLPHRGFDEGHGTPTPPYSAAN